MGTVQFTTSNSVSGINGSMRSYSLTGLEEDSEYDITIEAVNRAGRATSAVLTSRISGAGMLYNSHFMILYSLTFTDFLFTC